MNLRGGIQRKGSLVDFRIELAQHLIAGFSGRKRKSIENREVVHEPQNFAGHESTHMGTKPRCTHMNRKERKETVYGCKVCNAHLCKDGCHFAYYSAQ